MSTPSSPPTSPAYVPYQAYKSKRHSRNLSNSNTHLVPNQTPPLPKQLNGVDTSASLLHPPVLNLEIDVNSNSNPVPSDSLNSPGKLSLLEQSKRETYSSHTWSSGNDPLVPVDTTASPSQYTPVDSHVNAVNAVGIQRPSPSSMPTPLNGSSTSQSTSRKVTTFRRLHPKKSMAQSPMLHPVSTPSSPLLISATERSVVTAPPISEATPHVSSVPESPLIPPIELSAVHTSRLPSQALSHVTHISVASDAIAPERSSASSPLSSRKAAPYRPGFQPKGLYRSLTDEFLAVRKLKHDGDSTSGQKRIERTKLERRLEKLILLHFPHRLISDESKESSKRDDRPNLSTVGRDKRRAFFDLQSLRHLNINNPSDIWKGVVNGGLDSTKANVRAAEQRITLWQDDAIVSKCPLCSAVFHPLTNRKHHCRLCGQIICSLPVKQPQRPALCSVLFIVDSETRQIEEVDEGVDYGVRRRRHDSHTGPRMEQEDEKFLKGVRVCRECRPALLRQQYHQQAQNVPPLIKLYEAFINLEVDIEESLPKFQELIMTLTHNDQPTKEASAARKHLLDSFAQYDKLSKKIYALPSPNGPGSSQDRVQAAILIRANLFLQKNMFPLQSLPTPRSTTKVYVSSETAKVTADVPTDIFSALAHRLQPLLEQESLLESFVAEAATQRKFEDVKTLKANLSEIRLEIERLLEGNKR
ncbi:hypothetical protein CPB84DRAFT_1419349 [Gymnopilus junonius]|uniref:FYVE-type domain-containing protein n=1 Tax=Gymnopilus junonius TaxID=109634 RepID=A0A9P5TLK2_GYMJU|nr:hypothetical protein CPB84DRAFT_1419349 [Gymnopilus junonius]